MGLHVLALRVDLRLPGCRSLKEKRSRLRPIVDGARHRFAVSITETDHQDDWQQAEVGVAVAASSVARAEEAADRVERFVWSRPDIEVAGIERAWLELDR